MAPIGLVVLSALGLVSGVLAGPRNFQRVEVPASDPATTASETAAEGEVRTMVRFERARRTAAVARVWTCGASEASAFGGSYKRCEWDVSK